MLGPGIPQVSVEIIAAIRDGVPAYARPLEGAFGAVRAHIRAAGRQADLVAIFHLHDGKVSRQLMYLDSDRALADLGLPPHTSPQGS